MSDSKKVLLVGWDAADWKVIDPLMAAGHMPATRSLVERGVRGNLATLFPALSPMLWTSIATGKRPHKHGIYGFTEPTPDGSAVQPMTNVSRRCKAIWNILNQQGHQSLVVGWWPSHPAEPINGVMVSDSYHKVPRKPGAPWGIPPTTIHPERCFDELHELRLHPTEVEPEQILPFIPEAKDVDQSTDSRLASCMRVLCEATNIHSAATHLMETEPWDFAAVYYDAIDHFSHGFMRYHPPKQSDVSAEDFRLFQHVVNTGYIYHDMMLARLLELADDDTTVLLISDHGFHPDHLRPTELPAEPAGPATEHRDYGIFVAAGPGIRSGGTVTSASLLDITPTILPLFGLPVGDDMDGRTLTEIFETPPSDESVATWDEIAGDDGQHPEDFQLGAADSREALEQLIALGYIDRPSEDPTEAIAQCRGELDYNLARAYMDAGMHGEAIPLLAALYSNHPLEFRFGVQLANCLRAMGRHRDLERVINDLNARWRVARAEAGRRLRDVAKITREREVQWNALKAVDDEHADDPGRPALARTNRAGKPVVFNDGEMHQIRKLRAVARGNPQTLDFLSATIAISNENYELALEKLEAAGITRAAAPGLQYQVGTVYLKLGRHDEAEKSFRAALARDAFFVNGMVGLAQVYLQTEQYDDALDCTTRAIELKHHLPAGHYFRGLAQEQLGQTDAALASFELALEQNPNFPEAHDAIAEAMSHFSESRFDAERTDEHRAAAKDLREQAAELSDDQTLLELPDVDAEAIKAAMPEIKAEQQSNTEVFLRCLGQAPLPGSESAADDAALVTVVSGLPRSGTSMMMQMLTAGGLTPHTDEERTPDESNPRGYFEAERVKNLANENRWLLDCNNEVIKVVAQLIPYLPQGVNYRVVYLERDLDEVLNSQDAMLARLHRSGADLDREQIGAIFTQQAAHMFDVLKLHEIPVLRVAHREAISAPAAVATRVNEFLGGNLDHDAMTATVDPTLYRQRGETTP